MDTFEGTPKWTALCKLGVGAGAALGLGAEAMVKLKWSPRTGKFFFNLHAGLVVGAGASGEFGAEVDAGEFVTMVHCVYNALLEVDFRHVEGIEENAFGHLLRIGLYSLLMGVSIASIAAESVMMGERDLRMQLDKYFQSHRSEMERERLAIITAKNVLIDIEKGSINWILHAPPEVKGSLLDVLCSDYGPSFWDKYTSGFSVRERAILSIFELSQSWRDYQETVSRMNQTGDKASFVENRKRLVTLMRLFPSLRINVIDQRLVSKTAVPNEPVRIARHFSPSEARYV